ncbi:Stf0 family sulfotransferase [Paraburkholderia sp.]|uniref:Stf0 family sulfotransferase n=1 Tax=Paraburkholderia sp. TaxID=1926495 RepID=UPI003C7E0EB5
MSFHTGGRIGAVRTSRWISSGATYVICTNPRSGSWLLAEGLAATGLAGNPREWFNVQEELQQRAQWRMDHKRDLTSFAYLRIACAKSKTKNGISGIKVHYYQVADLARRLDLPGVSVSQLMMRLFPGAKYIWLRRRDKVRQAISLSMAFSTGEWWVIPGVLPEMPDGNRGEPSFNPLAIARLERALEENDANWKNLFRENSIDPLVVDYENLASDYQGTVTTVLEWLGIVNADAVVISPSRLQQQSNDRTEKWVTLYTEFKHTGGNVPEQRDESGNALNEPQVLAGRETIPSAWKQWVGQSRMNRISDDVIVETLVGNGYGRDAALAEIARATSDPYLIGGARMRQRQSKAMSLLNIQGQLAQLDAQARTIERRTVIAADEFRDRYYAANRPVVIQNLMSEWRAIARWTPEYLKRTVGNRNVEVMTGRDANPKCEMNAHRNRTEVPFDDYVDMVFSGKVTNDYYMVPNNRFLQKPEAQPLLRDFAAFPQYLRSTNNGAGCFLWFGPAGTVTPLHHDTSNILLAQVVGRKRYRIIPAAQWQYIYNSTGVFSDVDCERPDLVQFPKFRHATVIDLVVQPGEVLFMPVGWWHHVRALDVSMTISFTNFIFPNNFTWEMQ